MAKLNFQQLLLFSTPLFGKEQLVHSQSIFYRNKFLKGVERQKGEHIMIEFCLGWTITKNKNKKPSPWKRSSVGGLKGLLRRLTAALPALKPFHCIIDKVL